VRSDRRAIAVVLVAVLALAGCTGSRVAGKGTVAPGSTGPTIGRGTQAPPVFPSQRNAPSHQYYLSLGDSYPAGYQPNPAGAGRTTRDGFPYQVVHAATAKGYDYTLVNFACSGATTTSILRTPGCAPRLLGPGAAGYGSKTQAEAALQFLATHRGEVGLITISIGGNDVLNCGVAADPASCLTGAVRTIATNLGTLLARIRAAAGPDTRIVGTTYPDLFLGDLISGGATAQQLANLSVLAFKSLLNPQLADVYSAAGAKFVDVTKATGGYGSLSRTTTLAPYGRIPVPVARVCVLTWYCQLHDVHPRPIGHALIARLIVGTLPPQ
jgi:lysophospholipase L1-like esterase